MVSEYKTNQCCNFFAYCIAQVGVESVHDRLVLSSYFIGKNSAEGALADAIIDGLHDMRAAVDKGVDVSSLK